MDIHEKIRKKIVVKLFFSRTFLFLFSASFHHISLYRIHIRMYGNPFEKHVGNIKRREKSHPPISSHSHPHSSFNVEKKLLNQFIFLFFFSSLSEPASFSHHSSGILIVLNLKLHLSFLYNTVFFHHLIPFIRHCITSNEE